MTVTAAPCNESIREKALSDYRKKLLEHKEVEGRLKESGYSIKNEYFFNQIVKIY